MGLISNMWLFFCYTIQFITIKLCTKFQNPNQTSCWEIFDEKKNCDRNFIGEKEKTINKGTDKQWSAVLLLHITTNYYQALYQILESLLK